MRPELPTLTGGIEVALGPRFTSAANLPAPFFGRGATLESLRRIGETVRTTGECRSVTVVGAAGLGKTRLIEEFIRSNRPSDDHAMRLFRSSAAVGDSPWACFAQLLMQRFDVADALGPEEAKLGVRAQVEALLDDRKVGDVLHVLGSLIGLEFPDSPITKALGDEAVDGAMPKRAVLKTLLEADAVNGPLCLVFDDLHMAHADTIAMLHFLIENIRGPVFFLAGARPELLARSESQLQHERHALLHLEPLGEVDTAALIGTLLSPGGLTPMHVVEQAREVTGGNPGRIEETARYYRDRGTLPPPPAAPESALQARIDELAPADRLLLQRAALMGGVFWFGGLVVLDRADREPPVLWNEEDDESCLDITDRLQRLMEGDYVMRLPDSTFPGDEEYVFRHRSERERISALTSPADARKWHRLLADWLDSKPEIRTHEQYLEMLAEQREKSGIADWAARAYLEAAGRSRAHGSVKRELGYYDKALTLLGEHDYGRRLDALLRTGELLEGLDRPADALVRYREALTLAFRLDRRPTWVAARLSATRVLAKLGLVDESMAHLSQNPPPVEPISDAGIEVDIPIDSGPMQAASPVEIPANPEVPNVVNAAPATSSQQEDIVTAVHYVAWPDPMQMAPPANEDIVTAVHHVTWSEDPIAPPSSVAITGEDAAPPAVDPVSVAIANAAKEVYERHLASESMKGAVDAGPMSTMPATVPGAPDTALIAAATPPAVGSTPEAATGAHPSDPGLPSDPGTEASNVPLTLLPESDNAMAASSNGSADPVS